ncbi:Cytochrome P450 [Mycena sanguinolenta]|uniref:Cytochrome P450 n=1 Tax=Mycena sanguinolenta TaxID=230812 RepID=A0A8H7DH68_9AGAR|nr:Cytochrome P450 [Mycena sanguinolenta]
MTIAAITVAYSLRRRRTPPLPPGPWRLPIVGNILDLPPTDSWLKFAKLGEVWGEILSLTVLGQTMIIVNSLEIAEDLLETHGVNFSDRPVMPMAGELMGFNNVVSLVQYGDRVKRERKLFHQLFGNSTSIITQFGPLLTSEVHKFLQNLLRKPEDALSQIERMTGSITLRIAYGYNIDPDSQQDSFLEMFITSARNFSVATSPGAFLVDIIPALRYWPEWLPGGGFHATAKEWSRQLHRTVDTSCEYVKEQMAAGNIEPSFTSHLLQEGSHEEYLIKWAAVAIQGGGADTTAAQIKAFFRAMSLYPEVQAAAQKEIDTVVGNDRLPNISDRERLPYVNALCKEVLRYHVALPTGIPHRARADFIYEPGEGATPMLIPKDSLVIPNIWKLTHDPAIYANPMYLPWYILPLKPLARLHKSPTIGKLLADKILFLACSATLSVFNISKARENGIIIEPPSGQTTGTMRYVLAALTGFLSEGFFVSATRCPSNALWNPETTGLQH